IANGHWLGVHLLFFLYYEKLNPPLISTFVPVTKLASSDAKYTTRSATSFACPSRRSGVAFAVLVRASGLVNVSWNVVAIMPGATALTRIPLGPSSLAKARVYVINAPLEVA